MKKIKGLVVGVILGSAIGLWFGVNIGKDRPIMSDPFAKVTLEEKFKQTGEKLLEKSGEIMKKSGQKLEQGGRMLQQRFEEKK